MSGWAFVVLKGSPAAQVLMSDRLKGFRPGGVVVVTEEELVSMRNDIEPIEVPDRGHMPRSGARRVLMAPDEIFTAAKLISDWAAVNDQRHWMIDGIGDV